MKYVCNFITHIKFLHIDKTLHFFKDRVSLISFLFIAYTFIYQSYSLSF